MIQEEEGFYYLTTCLIYDFINSLYHKVVMFKGYMLFQYFFAKQIPIDVHFNKEQSK